MGSPAPHLLLLCCLGAPAGAAAASVAETSPSCPAGFCEELRGLPVGEWSLERSTPELYTFPWGASYAFQPLDYVSLANEVCACLQATEREARPGGAPASSSSEFVTRNGTQFELHGEPFRFLGFNHPTLVRYAASEERVEYLIRLLDEAEALGLRVARTWAHYEGYDVRQPGGGGEFGWLSLQLEPSKYNETTFEALDRVLHEASLRGMRLVLSLSDFVGAFGRGMPGFESYLTWAAASLNVSSLSILDFYTDPRPRLLFKANLCRMANRVNSITGVPYRQDPAILAWEVMNEPKCPGFLESGQENALVNWVAEMSSFMKCIDPNHLVSVGMEGHYGPSSPWRYPDMPGAWTLCQGQDYDRLISLPSIDYGAAHFYENMRGNWDEYQREFCSWEQCTLPWLEAWVTGHLNESRLLGKPFILEEFNVAYSEERRNEMFRTVQRIFEEDVAAHPDSAAAGALFWQAAVRGGVNTDGFNIYLDGTLALPPPEGIYGEKSSTPTILFLDEVRRMEEGVRRRLEAERCFDRAKIQLRPLYELPGLKNYSSNSTVALLAELAAEAVEYAESIGEEVGRPQESPEGGASGGSQSSAAPGPQTEPGTVSAAGAGTCGADPTAICECLAELLYEQWGPSSDGNATAAAASTTWVWPGGSMSPTLPEPDYAAMVEAVCDCVADAAPAAAAPPDPPGSFASRDGSLLMLEGKPLFFVGFNAMALPQWAHRGWPGDLAAVDALLSNASRLGFTVGRISIPGDGPDLRLPSERALWEPLGAVWTSLQPEAGVFDEAVFQALDYVLASAARHGVRLILVLGSGTASNIGVGSANTPTTYMQWVAGSLNLTGPLTMLDFYQHPRPRLLYKNFLCTLVNRANHVTGVRYRDDPTIFSWELMHDPRCPGCPGATKGAAVSAWAGEMSAFLKCIDPNHLVSVAQLGWYGDSSPEERAALNPELATECEGSDFLQLGGLPAVDYAMLQMSDLYSGYDQSTMAGCGWECHLPWFQRWLATHMNDTQELLGRPLLLSWVGKTYHEDKRNQLFSLVQEVVGEAWQARGADSVMAGWLFAAANVWNQSDWEGQSVYLDGALPREVPDRVQVYPREEQAFLDAVKLMQEAFERHDLANDCRGRATSLHMHLYNTTTLKVYESNSTVAIIAEMAEAAEQGTF